VVSQRISRIVLSGVLLACAVTVAFLLSMALIALTGGSAFGAASAMLQGGVESTASLMTSLQRATPLLLVAIGTVIAGRAGLINVGQEGQVLIGATTGTAFGVYVIGSGWAGQAGTLLAAALGGAAWAGIAAVLRTWARVNETVSTLLLNYVAVQLVSFLVSERYLLQAPPGSQAISQPLPTPDNLPNVLTGPGYALTSGFIVAVLLAVASAVLLKRSHFGLDLRVLGFNPQSADTFGIRRNRVLITSLMASGATAGLAGGALLSINPGGVTPTFSSNYGWDGLLVALVANYQPLTIIPVALGFGIIRAGSDFVVASGVNATIAYVFEGLIALAVLLPTLVLRRQVWALRLAQVAVRRPGKAGSGQAPPGAGAVAGTGAPIPVPPPGVEASREGPHA
jgi:simple sugar transport system permease protein